ncbi:MAG: RNA-binding S4 domain-containing protein [Pyrinomonadaceae bacterium]|nr:RNA-binding S4 domain-containing protein [Pyrinomonadaceae bacterium]
MRLDLFLKLSRLVSKRTLAKEFTKKGLVKVNGVIAKAAYDVTVGDIIEIKTFRRLSEVEVLKVPTKKQVSKQAAKALYLVRSDVNIEDDLLLDAES